MFFQVTSQDRVTEKSGSLEPVNNGTELDSLYNNIIKDIKGGKVVLLVIGIVLLIIACIIAYNMRPSLSGFELGDYAPFGVFGLMIAVVLLIFFFQTKFQKKITANFYNYNVYRIGVRLENKGVHSDDDGDTYYCDLVSSNGDFTINHVHINYTAYREFHDGYLYIIVDEKNKELIYYSKTVFDGSDLY